METLSLFKSVEEYFSIRTKTPSTVEEVLDKQTDIEIDGLNIFEDGLHEGQLVFIVLGGDKGKKEVTWDTGLIGIGRIIQSPYDKGYFKKNFKVKIKVELLLERPMSRHDLLYYANAYNVIGIGPMTKWEPNQAISKVERSKAITLVRAMLDTYPEIEDELKSIFNEEFMKDMRAENEYFIPTALKYGEERVEFQEGEQHTNTEWNNTYNPLLTSLKGNLQMDDGSLHSFINYINVGKHIIFTGPPGTGKTTLAENAAEEAVRTQYVSGYILTTATSDWSTFETIGGYMPDLDGKLTFEEGIFLKSIRQNKWLIIDEFNRTEADKSLGQLFTILSGKDIEIPFKSSTTQKNIMIRHHDKFHSFYDQQSSTYYIGKNWRVITTMNTFDKNSLFALSYALMRRFAFINIGIPKWEYIKSLIQSSDLEEEFNAVIEAIIESSPRPVGPAIIQEILSYIKIVGKRGITEAVCSLLVPQFEGLLNHEIKDFYTRISAFFDEEQKEFLINYLTDFFDISKLELIPDVNTEDES